MKQFTPEQKHEILLEYQPHTPDHSFATLATRHRVAGGRDVVRRWFKQWDGTAASLQRKPGSGRPRVLTTAEVQQHVATTIRDRNRSHQPIHYNEVQQSVTTSTGKRPSLRTIQRYGRDELGGRQKHGKKRTANECNQQYTCTGLLRYMVAIFHMLIQTVVRCMCAVSVDLCDEIAKLRRKLQRIGPSHILVLDETHKREGDVTTRTIVLPHEPSFIETSTTSRYAPRYDMIACCTNKEVLPPMILEPKERGRGIDTNTLLQHIRNLLAQAVGALDRYPLYLLVDKASIHNEEKIMEAFHDWGCQELVQVLKMPTAAAKRMSPLDNSFFNVWRQRVLECGPLTRANIKQRMSDAWNSITAADLRAQYQHCGLIRGQDVYFDCPDPTGHAHNS